MEITTKCNGAGGKLCSFCYKSNTPKGKNMEWETFKNIIDKMKPAKNKIGITQVAFGADASCTSNPHIWDMMDYCRKNKVIPNITVADITDETADNLVKRCGAVAVSRYADKNICYDSVKRLTDRGLKQCNIHIMISKETYDDVIETVKDYTTDERLKGLNAIVLLSLKQKGRGTKHTPLTKEEFKSIVDMAFDLNVPIGFDSCSAPKFLDAVKDRENYKVLEMLAEPCESSCFSSYINVNGDFFPCSFMEGSGEWTEGIDVVRFNCFENVWFHPKVNEFRKKLLSCNRNCPEFNV